MTTSAFSVALLVAWPAVNILLAALAVTIAGRADRRRRKRPTTTPPAPAVAGATGTDDVIAAAAAARVGPSADLLAPEAFWIVVPCGTEEQAAGKTVRSALELAAADSTTEVVVVGEAGDDSALRATADIDHPGLHVVRRPAAQAGTGKGAALNLAYAYINRRSRHRGVDPRRVVVGVLDSATGGSPNLLTEVAEAMRDPRIAAIQSRVRVAKRDTLLGRMQDLESGCVTEAGQVLRSGLRTAGLGATGQFARLSMLRRFGPQPWSGEPVEDQELGLRLRLAGAGIGYVWRAWAIRPGPKDVKDLLYLRTRSMQGNLRSVRYLPRLLASPAVRGRTFLEMAYYLVSPWLAAAVSGAFVLLWAYAGVQLAVGPSPLAGAPGAALWLAATLLPGVVWAVLHRLRLRDESLVRCLVAGLAYPGLHVLGLVSTGWAVARQLGRRDGRAARRRIVDEPAAVPAG